MSVEPAGSVERVKAPVRIDFQDFTADWHVFAGNETAGLHYLAARTRKPDLEFWAIRADLSKNLNIVVSSSVYSARVSSFVRDYGLFAGINTVPFDPVSSREGEKRRSAGIVVSNGAVIAPPTSGYDALVFFTDGRPAIIPQAEIDGLSEVKNAVGGFRIVLRGGEVTQRAETRHPRSAAGLSADGRFLYLLVIDGRRRGSAGATEAEIGLILKKLGASEGLNFDGGGSSALALRFPDDRVRTVNTPIHGGRRGKERAVAACLGIGIMENPQNYR